MATGLISNHAATATGESSTPGSADGRPLRGNFFAKGSYVRTNVKTGVARNRAGTRICTLPSDFLLGFHKAVNEECGPAADSVIKGVGVRWGSAFARRMESELSSYYEQPLGEFATAEFFACLVEGFAQNGWGKLQIDLEYHDRGVLVAVVEGAIMASLVGKAAKPADTLLAGTIAGFFRQLTGEDLDCVQTQCSACRAKDSRFVISLTSRLTPVSEWVASGLSHGEILVKLLTPRN